MRLLSVIGLAAARSMVSMSSCNSVTTLTLELAARSVDSDEITLPRRLLLYLRSYLSLARFILNFYVSCGWWLTCRRLSISISLGTRTTLLSGVRLAHLAIIGMRLALSLRTLLPYTLICRYMASPASVRLQSAPDYVTRSAVDNSHPRHQGIDDDCFYYHS